LKSVNLIKNKDGSKTGQAILTYNTNEDADGAIKGYNGQYDLELQLFKGKIPSLDQKVSGKPETLSSRLN
jgi:hypothetical protein